MTHSYRDLELSENPARELPHRLHLREKFNHGSAPGEKKTDTGSVERVSMRDKVLDLQRLRLKIYSPFENFDKDLADDETNRRLGKVDSRYLGE